MKLPKQIIIHDMIFKFDSIEEDEYGNWYIYVRNNAQSIIILESLIEGYFQDADPTYHQICLDRKDRTIKELELELEEKILSIMNFSVSFLNKAIKIQKTKALQ